MDDFNLDPSTLERLGRAGEEFLVRFFRTASERDPENLDALSELGHALTRLGRIEEGLEADERLVRLAPTDATVHYNLACSLALLGRTEKAFAALLRAVALGYDDVAHLERDQDLASLFGDERFSALVARLRGAGGEPS